jgi:uncharacterized membrane protein
VNDIIVKDKKSNSDEMKISERLQWGYNVKTHWILSFFRILLGLSLLFAGVSHLTFARAEFVAQVPNWVPVPDDLTVLLSGFAEILLGLALLVLPGWKALTGWVVAIFFVIIFPGNIAQYMNQIDAFGLDTDRARLIRLFFQPVLVAWALWSTGAYNAFKNRNINTIVRKK